MNNKIKVVLVAIILAIVTFTLLSIFGRTYTLNVYLRNVENPDRVKIVLDQDEEFIEITDTILKGRELFVKLHSLKAGKTHFSIIDENNENVFLDTFYVNDLGIITQNGYFGYSNGSIVMPICTSIFLAYSLYILVNLYRKSMKDNMYRYKDISRLGLIIFLSFSLITQLLSLNYYRGVTNTINDILSIFQSFSIILLPIAFLVSLFVTISNLILVKKEGFNVRNILGFILGVFFCFITVFPEIIRAVLLKINAVNLYNENAIDMYIVMFLQTAISVIVTYLEYNLIATIVHGVKAAKHIPTMDKDYIIILGCQIKKDGSLTPLLKSRADRAIEFAKLQKEKTGKDIVFVPSGGKGEDEVIAEGEAIKKYLLEQGIDEDHILLENKSKNTYENIKFSKELIDSKNPKAKIAFSTTNYHVYRAGAIAQEQGINVEGIGAKTKTYFWINAFIREFIATIVTNIKTHVFMITAINGLMILMVVCRFLDANMYK